ncbi:MAG: hypothetical protein D6679_01300 [Candidatus Hydrogenedentota bacterium]|nr:MAG: hypothetical protein D6679_01300 [Candidatus Hydrogenedentota bacterium]
MIRRIPSETRTGKEWNRLLFACIGGVVPAIVLEPLFPSRGLEVFFPFVSLLVFSAFARPDKLIPAGILVGLVADLLLSRRMGILMTGCLVWSTLLATIANRFETAWYPYKILFRLPAAVVSLQFVFLFQEMLGREGNKSTAIYILLLFSVDLILSIRVRRRRILDV